MLSKHAIHDVSTCGSKSLNEHSYDTAMGEIPQEEIDSLLSAENEQGFSVSVQKKRRKLLDILKTKRPNEIVISPHKKAFKG